MSDSPRPHGLHNPWNSPGQNAGVGSLSLLQGIFLTQGSNPGLPCCRWILHQLSHQGSPRILEWVPYPFSSLSSQPRNQTQVSHIAEMVFISALWPGRGFPDSSVVKNLPATWETWVRSLGWGDPLEEGMAIHSSILAWRNPRGQRSLAGYSPWGLKESETTERLSTKPSLKNI